MKLKVIVWLAVMFWLPSLASGQDLEPQTWLGELDVKVAKLRLEVRVKSAEDGSIKAQMFSLDQNNAEIPVDSFVLDGQSVAMKMESVGASFEGELSEDGLECVGTFAQGGQEFPLVFKKVDKVPERKHVANWAGTLKAGGQEFEFQLRVFEDDDGKQSAVLDSFSESIQGLSTEYVQDGNDFRFDVPLSAGKFVGVLNADRTKVVGKWIQGGGEYDLEFDSVALEDTRKLERKRPQTPKPPFDYDVTELSITNDAANVELHGTLTTPKGAVRSGRLSW